MDNWIYGCSECSFTQKSDKKIKYFVGYDCPKCKEGYVLELQTPVLDERTIPMISIEREPKTVGELARRNSRKMGKQEVEERVAKDEQVAQEAARKASKYERIKKETPWWRSGEVPGLPKRDKPISIDEAYKMGNELGIRIKEPKKRKKK
jgi:hypothetical protein